MSQQHSQTLELSDLILILRRYRKFIALTMLVCVGGFVAAAMLLPKKYKSTATISIYTKYFQNPLVKDFLPEIYDTGELRSQRETLIRQAFDPQFLDLIGEKYGLFTTPADPARRLNQREQLLKSVEVFSVQATTFQVGYSGNDPRVTYEILQEILARVTTTLASERRKTIERLRDSIRKRVESISLTMQTTADPLASVRPEILRKELERIEAQLHALKTQYTEQHPQVSKLQARANLLRSWLNKAPGGQNQLPASPVENPALVGGEPKEATFQVYEDLLKKLNYLNITLEMEKDAEGAYVGLIVPPNLPTSPTWPKKSVFLLWGLLSGILLSMFSVLVREYFERTAPSVEDFSHRLGVKYLGGLPRFPWTGTEPDPHGTGKKKPVASQGVGAMNEWN